jgi:hypothetical protein
MPERELFQAALGLTPPWQVVRSDFDREAGERGIYVAPGDRGWWSYRVYPASYVRTMAKLGVDLGVEGQGLGDAPFMGLPDSRK